MRVEVLFFGGLREAIGCAAVELAFETERAGGGVLLAAIEARLIEAYPRFQALRRGVRVAVNEDFVDDPLANVHDDSLAQSIATHVRVNDGDVVAYIPPVSGG